MENFLKNLLYSTSRCDYFFNVLKIYFSAMQNTWVFQIVFTYIMLVFWVEDNKLFLLEVIRLGFLSVAFANCFYSLANFVLHNFLHGFICRRENYLRQCVTSLIREFNRPNCHEFIEQHTHEWNSCLRLAWYHFTPWHSIQTLNFLITICLIHPLFHYNNNINKFYLIYSQSRSFRSIKNLLLLKKHVMNMIFNFFP